MGRILPKEGPPSIWHVEPELSDIQHGQRLTALCEQFEISMDRLLQDASVGHVQVCLRLTMPVRAYPVKFGSVTQMLAWAKAMPKTVVPPSQAVLENAFYAVHQGVAAEVMASGTVSVHCIYAPRAEQTGYVLTEPREESRETLWLTESEAKSYQEHLSLTAKTRLPTSRKLEGLASFAHALHAEYPGLPEVPHDYDMEALRKWIREVLSTRLKDLSNRAIALAMQERRDEERKPYPMVSGDTIRTSYLPFVMASDHDD